MSEITTLFTQYSIEELILLIILILFVLRALNEIISYFYTKIKARFGIENDKQKWEDGIASSLEDIKGDLKNLHEQQEKSYLRQKEIDAAIALVQERMQENTRSYLIDAHHKFCYERKAIDELNLQSMERRYLYYKAAGGDSFIDGLMEEVRKLPRINLYTGVIENEIDDRREK